MKHRLSPAQSRAAALTLLVLAVLAAAAAVALPTWLLHRHYDTYLEDYSDRLARYQRIAALRPAVEESIKAVEARASQQYYLKSASAPSATAELQALATKIVESHKGRVISSQAQSGKEEKDSKGTGPAKVTISVQMNASIVSLMLILHTLETSQPYLFVDQLTVRAAQGRLYRPVAGVEPEFWVQMTISGYTLPGASKS